MENTPESNTPPAPETSSVPPTGTHPYHAPQVLPFGALPELTLTNPGRGTDGGTGDCTFS